jgi:DNA-binding NarL/FixJ family response regulator
MSTPVRAASYIQKLHLGFVIRSTLPMRVVLVSAEPILLYGLEGLLEGEADLEVSVVRARARDSVAALPVERPDVLLLDVSLSDADDLAALRELAALPDPPATVVLVSEVGPEELLYALELGVRGVLVKNMASRLFVECLRKVARGERWVELRSESRALEHLVRRETVMRKLARQLTARELEIVPLVAEGLSNKEIGARLGISHATVKVHLKHVFRKLGIDGRLHLLRWAEERGLRRGPGAFRGEPG